MLIDSHCHVDFDDLYTRIDDVRQAMRDHQVTHALCVCVTIEEAPNLLAKIAPYPEFSASIGTHPDYEDVPEPSIETIVNLCQHPRVVAVGETGLDYYRLKNSPALDWQRARFVTHIQAAQVVKKPLIIHSRAAPKDTLDILRAEKASTTGGVFHCFTESYETAKLAIDMGFYISFSGVLTFKNAKNIQETAKKLPLNAILVETDSPYLAPEPYRGKTNQPAWVRHVAQFLATLRGVDFETIANATTHNYHQLFGQNGVINHDLI